MSHCTYESLGSRVNILPSRVSHQPCQNLEWYSLRGYMGRKECRWVPAVSGILFIPQGAHAVCQRMPRDPREPGEHRGRARMLLVNALRRREPPPPPAGDVLLPGPSGKRVGFWMSTRAWEFGLCKLLCGLPTNPLTGLSIDQQPSFQGEQVSRRIVRDGCIVSSRTEILCILLTLEFPASKSCPPSIS